MDENRWKLWVFKKYFDDLNVIMNATKAGIKFVEGKAIGGPHIIFVLNSNE